MKKFFVTCSVVFMLGMTWAQAQTSTPQVDQRQENQKNRIQQGAASGELTRMETKNVVQDQRHIRRAERRMEADGKVTKQERARLHHKQNKASRKLNRNKHDAQARPQ